MPPVIHREEQWRKESLQQTKARKEKEEKERADKQQREFEEANKLAEKLQKQQEDEAAAKAADKQKREFQEAEKLAAKLKKEEAEKEAAKLRKQKEEEDKKKKKKIESPGNLNSEAMPEETKKEIEAIFDEGRKKIMKAFDDFIIRLELKSSIKVEEAEASEPNQVASKLRTTMENKEKEIHDSWKELRRLMQYGSEFGGHLLVKVMGQYKIPLDISWQKKTTETKPNTQKTETKPITQKAETKTNTQKTETKPITQKAETKTNTQKTGTKSNPVDSTGSQKKETGPKQKKETATEHKLQGAFGKDHLQPEGFENAEPHFGNYQRFECFEKAFLKGYNEGLAKGLQKKHFE